MNDITYIFGAGASAQAMPLVSNFSSRFQVFEEYVDGYLHKPPGFIYELRDFGQKIKSHFSFDTFFKKLFHQDESTEIIDKYKSVLLLFFIFEHLINLSDLMNTRTHRLLLQEGKGKTQNLDPRYDALIAGLLKPVRGKPEFFTNVNFITWNYDINLISALKNFISPLENYTDFVSKRKEGNHFRICDQVNLFHLNGVINHPILNDFNDDNAFLKYQQLINTYKRDSTFKEYLLCLKFAWEQDEFNADLLANTIKQSKTVIISGYSLPLYNREIDSIFINQSILSRKNLFIQDYNANNIAEILESDFNITVGEKNRRSKEDPIVRLSESCNSFIVPNTIFER